MVCSGVETKHYWNYSRSNAT